MRLVEYAEQVCLVCLFAVFDCNQRPRIPRQLKVFGDHQGQWLPAVAYPSIEQWAKRRTFGSVGVTVVVVVAGNLRPMGMVQHSDHARHFQCLCSVDLQHPTTGDGAGHDTAVQ
ncbi:hypothetical protein D3C71_1469100 [compost metagenome]